MFCLAPTLRILEIFEVIEALRAGFWILTGQSS